MQERGFLILDFGSQVTQLIARRYRELGFYSEIHPHSLPIEKIKSMKPLGIVLSGGPNSVYEEASPKRDLKELLEVAPLFGICYGMQLIAQQFGGSVSKGQVREYGQASIEWQAQNLKKIIDEIPKQQSVWMSHGDVVKQLPPGFEVLAQTSHHLAAMGSENILAVQFHPEVTHTESGQKVLMAFAKMCKAQPSWSGQHRIDVISDRVKKQVGDHDHILCALSGGVDSSVVAYLLTKIFGAERVHCIFVDTGLLRQGEYEQVLSTYKKFGLNVMGVKAADDFLSALKGKSDPEEKRKIIGRFFIETFDKFKPKNDKIKYLAQGTLYPDVIESVSIHGSSVTIKSHHNVGGLPEKMNLKLVEPVRELFKDEVRMIGRELGLPQEMISRHPFPGPGLAIRIIGEVTEEKVKVLQEADHVYISFLREKGLYEKIWQAFCVLLPVQTVGVMGDGRTYENVLALRAVTSIDGMTADWYAFQTEDLREVSNRITNRVKGVNRVVYDITSKPPATIEWE